MCSLKSIYADRHEWNGISPLPCSERGTLAAVQEAFTEEHIVSTHAPGIPQISAFAPSMSGLSAPLAAQCMHVYLRHPAITKLQIWGPSAAWTLTGPLGEGLGVLGLGPFCPRSAVALIHRSLKFRVKCSRKSEFRLSAPRRCLWAFAN